MAIVVPGIYPAPGVSGPNGLSVLGPSYSTLNGVARWKDTAGSRLGDSLLVVDDAGNLTTPGTVNGRNVAADGASLDSLLSLVARIPSTTEKEALAGTDGTPGNANRYVTDSDPRLLGGGGGPPSGAAGGQLGGTYPNPDVRGIRETGGPTLLTVLSIADGSYLRRSGTDIIGQSTPFLNEGWVATATSLALNASHTKVWVTDTTAVRTITLPAVGGVPDGWQICIYDRTNAAGNPNAIAIVAAGAETINGSVATRYIKVPGDSVAVVQMGGAWYFSKFPSDTLNVAAFGKLYADGIGDDYAVIQAALDAGPTPATDTSGFRVFLPRGKYRVSQTLNVRRPIVFEGESSGSNSGIGTTILPDKFAQGIRVSGIFDSGVANMRGDWATVRNLNIEFAGATQPTVWAPTTVYALGALVVATTASQAHHFVFRATVGGTSAGSQPAFSGLADGATVVDGTVTWTAVPINGVDLHVKACIENIYISNAPGNGVHIFGDAGGTPSTNCNEFTLRRLVIVGGWLNGIFVDGPNANAGYSEKCLVSGARYWGIYDSSFLGNTYVAHDVDTNGLGAYHDDDANAANVWLGCYSESGQPASHIGTRSVVIGGLHGAGFDTVYTGRNINARFTGDTPFNVIGQQNTVTLSLNHTSADKIAMRLQAGDEAGDLRWERDQAATGNGWWSWDYAGSGQYIMFAVGAANAGTDAVRGTDDKGAFWIRPSYNESFFYLGFLKQRIGNVNASVSAPTAAEYKKGDFAYELFYDYQGHAGGTKDGLHGWRSDKNGAPLWACRWPFWGHGSQQAKTTTVGSPYAIDMKADAGLTFTNQGAGAKVGITLPPTSGGGLVDEVMYVEYTFLCVDADGLRVSSVDAAIRYGGQATAAAGYLETTEIGASVTIKCYSSSFWYVSKITGTWTDGTSTFGATTAVVTQATSTTLAIADSGKTYINTGAGALVTLTLPATAAIGEVHEFYVDDADGIRVQAQGSDTIRNEVDVTAAAGYIESVTIGSYLSLKYVAANKWVAIQAKGLWATGP